MPDPVRRANDAAAELVAKAAVSAGKDAASRAARQLLGDDDAERSEASSKSRKWKLVAGAVLVLCVVLGLIGLVLNYWLWFLAAGVLGLGGLVGYWRLRSRLAARREAKGVEQAGESTKLVVDAKPARLRTEPVDDVAAQQRAQAERDARRADAERDARARAEAEALKEQEVDEELAELKARLGK